MELTCTHIDRCDRTWVDGSGRLGADVRCGRGVRVRAAGCTPDRRLEEVVVSPADDGLVLLDRAAVVAAECHRKEVLAGGRDGLAVRVASPAPEAGVLEDRAGRRRPAGDRVRDDRVTEIARRTEAGRGGCRRDVDGRHREERRGGGDERDGGAGEEGPCPGVLGHSADARGPLPVPPPNLDRAIPSVTPERPALRASA